MVNHNIFEKIVSIENLFAAWGEFKRGKIGKPEVQEFAFNLENNLFALREQLINGNYYPGDYASFYVRDPKIRPVHKARVRDRVLFQAVFRVLYHIFDRKFIFDSYSCRFDKGTHAGVGRLEEFLNKVSKNYSRSAFALKCDIRKFFYSIDHAVLLDLIKQEIDDISVIDLIHKIINSFCVSPGKGLPLGNVTSQLFANVYLNQLDQYAKYNLKERFYIRYCDDFIILGLDIGHLVDLVPHLNGFLGSSLQLSLHPNKIVVRNIYQGVDFLGYVCLPHYRVLRTKTRRRILKKLAKIGEKHKHRLIKNVSINQTVQSYLGIVKHCSGYKITKEIGKALHPLDRKSV